MKLEGRQVYSRDLNAPRMRKGKFSSSVITKELWKKFITTFKEYKDMTWLEFYQNWMDIAQTIRNETIYNPLGVKLGSYLGELKLQYLPYKFEAVDHSLSEKLGENVDYTNIVTKGKVAKIKWERRRAVKFNKVLQFYAFDETREMNNMVKSYILTNPDKVRVARNTLGGMSVWRQKIRGPKPE